MATGSLIFEDDFTGPTGTYDRSKWGEWSTATYNSSAAYGNIQPGDRSTLDGAGHLSIPATPTQGTSVSTKDHFTFTYGTATARMMIQTQPRYWPAFWILNSPANGTNANLVGEIDVLEAYTLYSDGYRAGAHNYVNGVDEGPTGGAWLGAGFDIRGSWHDYAARIEPNKVTFLFDGTEFFSFGPDHPSLAGKQWAWGASAQNWLILTNAIDVGSGSPPTASSALLVDRVEVRSLPVVSPTNLQTSITAGTTTGHVSDTMIVHAAVNELTAYGQRVLLYANGAYPARPSGVPAGLCKYIGPSQPSTWLSGDEWVNNS